MAVDSHDLILTASGFGQDIAGSLADPMGGPVFQPGGAAPFRKHLAHAIRGCYRAALLVQDIARADDRHIRQCLD